MARKIIDVGTVGNDGTGDSIRDSFRKVNDNFRELYSSLGLGEKLTFIGLDDTPSSYAGQNNATTGSTPIVTVNNTESGLAFKTLVPGNGISLDFITNPNEITINADFAAISADPNPQLGGNLSMRSGGNQWRIIDAGTTITPLSPVYKHELVNKNYADSKLSRYGTDAINPETGDVDAAFGRMSGPLILSRDPEPDDDVNFGGLIAATKRYVDSSSFGSQVNLYVALSGQDDRPGVSSVLQGRALAYAYRTLEAALKRAEELVLDARVKIGPYKKTLTYNNHAADCTLSAIESSPTSGDGFVGSLKMSVDTVTLNSVGTNYYPGDILQVSGGVLAAGGGACFIQVLSTLTTPGAILTYKIISTGSYTTLPGSTNIATTISESAAPVGVGAVGAGATFNITYKVSSVSIVSGGTGYSLVSVRISGGGGAGAFGTAVVTAGVITSITITDKGTGFTSLPTLNVDLPRFLIYTAGFRTDYTGDVTTNTAEATRSRDIREGLYLRGETSGALAQIVSHQGALDSNGNEIFDVDIKFGSFEVDEVISYGDISKDIQITVLVESGEYEENYPLKVPANVSIVGDEFRRVIFRPRSGTSSSPWAFQKFRRELTVDGITTATQLYGYHYLQDSSQPVYPKINNKGSYTSTAELLTLNRSFLQEEIIAWMDYNISNSVAPFSPSFDYNSTLCKRDVGLLVDSFVFDLKYGGYNRTISAGLKYYQSVSARIAITTQLSEYLSVLTHLESLMQSVITNTEITDVKQDLYLQIIDPAYSAETGSASVITALIAALKDVIDGSGSVNYPKDNEEMDVFLANDAVRWQAISAIGHGGFMGVLDPEGQILSRSPYFQECASFSRSQNQQVFAGGMLADGFAGNLEFTINNVVTTTRLEVTGLDRFPELPASYIVGDSSYRINYVRDFSYSPSGSTATFILDETTPWPYQVFTYNSAACSRDVGLIIDGLGYDIVLGTNYWTRQNGLTYRMSQSQVVINDQRTITLESIAYAHELARTVVSAYPTIQTTVDLSNATIADIIDRGTSAAPTLTFTLPSGITTNVTSAYNLLMNNRDYIVAEVDGWITAQISGNIAPWATGDLYNTSKSQRDTRLVIEAVVHDLIYGGNAATRHAALKYYNNLTGVGLLASGQPARCAAAIAYANYLAGRVVQNLAPAVAYSALSRTTGTAATATEAGTINTLMTAIQNAISVNNYTTAQTYVTLTAPTINSSLYTAANVTARSLLLAAESTIQAEVVSYVDAHGNTYELLMPGNRSMLANDYTQINDMGYGAIAMNGGLMELVSIFTYYCYTSYYSLTGGQIRSVAGSSAHGVYALVAEGADPLEVPTPTTIYEELSQRCDCYYPSPSYANTAAGLFIYVNNYEYTPLGGSELEVLHGSTIYRYPVTSVTTTDLPTGVARLNLSTGTGSTTQGLFDVVSDGTKLTLRVNNIVKLTGSLQDVAVRPSTGLKLRETSDSVYRVLQFSSSSDENGPYEILVSLTTPTLFKVLVTVITIASASICTTSGNHKLRIGDKFIPTSTANGFVSGTTYYVISVPAYNQFTVSTAPGGSSPTLTNGTGLTIKGVKTHKLLENYIIEFTTTGSLPSPLNGDYSYYVLSNDLTDTEFAISLEKNGTAVTLTTTGSGTHKYSPVGITLTNLRENYNYVELTIYNPGDFTSAYPTGRTCTINIAVGATITLASHGFVAGDAIKFTTTGSLPTGLSTTTRYFVLSSGLASGSFKVSLTPGGTAVDTTGSQSGVHAVGLVTGRVGDTTFAVVGIGSNEISRVAGAKFVFLGEEYIISTYQSEAVTNLAYARVILNRGLVNAVNALSSSYTIKAGVPIRSSGSLGTLTIRISLTRVTGHDLLEIGTGSYADTNYPKEIYGPSVNPINATNETDERDVGRCFYVTTDQYGNFRVGPYFAVDQGTGQVTFSSSIALSNLDGIGFKRGVPIAEFSTDSGMTDNATDTVPTENATRIYIERRLGITHDGTVVPVGQLIPTVTGGFLPLSGALAMGGDVDMNNHKIVNVTNPANPQDAVNLRSLTLANFQDWAGTNIQGGQFVVLTGSGNTLINASITGDLTFDLRAGQDSSLNNIDVQLNAGVVTNTEVSASAAIVQSKLNMTIAAASASSPSGSAATIQAASGLSSFDTAQFTVTNGWVTVKSNGLTKDRIEQITSKTVLGNSGLSTANVSEVTFLGVVDAGGAVKKSQYSSTGFLRRTSSISSSADADYTTIEGTAGSSTSVGASQIVIRDSNGDFGGRIVDISQLKIDTQVSIDTTTISTGGYIRYYGYNTAGGILIQDGSLAGDKTSAYWNDSHTFKTQNGVSLAPITASQIQVTAITTGGSGTGGTFTGNWTLTSGSKMQATYSADLAEWYTSDRPHEPGTVLVFGGEAETTTSSIKGDTRVAGVVSTDPAYVLNGQLANLKNAACIALQGRVPCRVVGKINKGDILITSGIPGVAMAATAGVQVGTVIGKALREYDSDHIGVIEIAVGRA